MNIKSRFLTPFRGVLAVSLVFNSVSGIGAAASASPALAPAIYQDLLQNHRVKNTGLFLSFPETRNHKLSQQALTEEQAAVGLLALQLGDNDTVDMILKFFDQRWDEAAGGSRRGGLANAYNAYFGTSGIEQAGHLGPNAWMGLLAARAARLGGSETGQRLALKIGRWIKDDVPHKDGAAALSNWMEPDGAPWLFIYSTQDNAGYDAFLGELLKLPLSDEDRQAFVRERGAVEYWLTHTAYQVETKTVLKEINPLGPDRTPVLGAYAGLFLAMGPRKLKEMGADPEGLVQNAGNLFEAKMDEAGYEAMGEYILFLEKMVQYSDPQGELKAKISKMTQSFDEGSLFPDRIPPRYAAATPSEDPTPALISSVWRAFVDLKYNPLRDATQEVLPPLDMVRAALWQTLGIQGDRERMVRYGTPDEMMSQILSATQGRRDDEALRESNALIQEWSVLAHEQQKLKKDRVGGLITDNGNPQVQDRIRSYSALNGVAAAFFTIGTILHNQGQADPSKAAFEQILKHYSLGQVWDSQNGFWSPAEAVQRDQNLTGEPGGAGLVHAAAISRHPSLDSIRPEGGDAQEFFDELTTAIKSLPEEQQANASRVLMQAVNDVGPQIFDAYLSSGFLNTWSRQKATARQVSVRLAEGDINGFKRDVMGSGPFEP